MTAVKRDLLAWLVDVSTVVVGIAAMAAFGLSVRALRNEGRRQERSWTRQLILDHNARVQEAAADAIRAVSVFIRAAERRVQARATAEVDHGYQRDTDETVELEYAALVDRLGGSRREVLEAHDEAILSLDRLWFLIPSRPPGDRLLKDIQLL
jgi:hypothetical protein